MKRLLSVFLFLNLVLLTACSSETKNQAWYNNQAFVKALLLSDFNSVSGYLYTSNIDVKGKNKDGETPLTLAIKNTSDAQIIKVLLEAGANPEEANKEGYTPLLLAAKNNINPNIAKLIIMTGADIEKADPSGKTPLILSAENKNKNVPLLLLAAGAKGRESEAFRRAVTSNGSFSDKDVQALLKDKIGFTVKIPWYSSKSFKEALASDDLKQIAAAAARTDLSAKDPSSNKDAASLLENDKTPQQLFIFARAGVDLNARDENGKTMLYKASEQGEDIWLKALLKAKADPNIRAKDASTPLMAAVENQPEKQENITALIKAGAEINAGYNKDGSTLLFKLIEENKDLKLIEFIIKSGAEVNIKNIPGDTPLITAAKYAKDPKIIELLLENKANIDAKNRQGFTPLLTAAANNEEPKIALALFKKSKNKLDEGHALDFAAQNPNKEVYNALIGEINAEVSARKNANDKNDNSIWFNNKALVAAIRKNDIPTLKRELKKEKELNLEALMQGQFNALMLAGAFSKTAEPINLLVEAGADINGTNNNGDTPLMTAVLTNKNLPAIQALIEAGADVNAVDSKGTSVIMAAANKNPNEKVPILLLQSGANVPDTRALLQYAQSNGNKKVYELLKKVFTKQKA